MHILSPETDNCPSWISGRERMTIENISWSIFTKECCRPRRGWTRDLLVSSRTAHPTEAGLPKRYLLVQCEKIYDIQPARTAQTESLLTVNCQGSTASTCGQQRLIRPQECTSWAVFAVHVERYISYVEACIFWTLSPGAIRSPGPSCSKLTVSLVNNSLKFTSTDTQIRWNFLLKKCE